MAVAVGVGVAVAVGVGVASDIKGATTSTVTGDPVLKNPMFAVAGAGAAVESNRKLYSVPQRISVGVLVLRKSFAIPHGRVQP